MQFPVQCAVYGFPVFAINYFQLPLRKSVDLAPLREITQLAGRGKNLPKHVTLIEMEASLEYGHGA